MRFTTSRASSALAPLLLLAACSGGDASTAPGGALAPGAPAAGGPSTGGPSTVVVDPTDVRSMVDTQGGWGPLRGDAEAVDDIGWLNATSTQSPTPTSQLRYRARFVPGFVDLLEFQVNNTGSGWQERFLVQLPASAPTAPVPMLVVFHKYGTSHGDVLNTSFLSETRNRGWYCVAPLGARQRHFGCAEFQINTRVALELVSRLFPIDRDRVYGVGFSMGGGALANYAARHLDPNGVRFAAICDHTGSVSLGHTWFWEPDDADLDDNVPTPGLNLEVPDVLESLYGGTPAQVPFEYARSSTVDLDYFTGYVQPGTDFARNLAHIPTLVWNANADPMIYLGTQTAAFFGHIQPQNPAHLSQVVAGNVHSWTTLDDTFVCDWLQQHTLQTPTSGSTLADEDGVWFHFQLEQDAAGSFTPFTWSVESAQRRFVLSQTANLRRLSVDCPAAGLALTGVVTVRVSAADGTGDRVRLLGATQAPTLVLRDGQPATATYDALTRSVEIAELDPAQHDWALTFP